MSDFRTIQWPDALISAFGLGMCSLAYFLFLKEVSFLFILMTGTSGLTAVTFGLSLIVDMYRYKNRSHGSAHLDNSGCAE